MSRRAACIAATILAAAGIILLLLPHVAQWMYAGQADHAARDFDIRMERAEALSIGQGAEGPSTNQDVSEEGFLDLDGLYADMVAYNRRIADDGQSGLVDAWSYQRSEIDLRAYGFPDQMIGYVEVPAIGQTLPLYLGATSEQMSLGAVQLTQTSMPIGSTDTNCVIAAHRGAWSSAMFRDIEDLEPGDEVRVTNPWGTLTYRVRETKVIAPNDIRQILIQKGKDMVTLITCHPYGSSEKRYVVYCDRT